MNYSKTSIDFDNLPEWITFLKDDLNLKAVGVGLIHLKAGKGYKFLHQHKEQEEIYFIFDGEGAIHIDGKEIKIQKGDIIKIDPKGKRALKASDESNLIAICVGGVPVKGYPKYLDSKTLIDDGIPDYDEPPVWYKNDKEVKSLLKHLKEKREARTGGK
ncbi:MAG: cupin domain-containing protein [Fidelibacterota bacterium]